MVYHPVDAVEPTPMAPQGTEEIGGLQAEAAVALTQSGEYVQSKSGNLDGFPQVQFENTEDFSPNSTVQFAANSGASEYLPAVEVPKQDGGLFAVVGDIIGGAVNHVIHNPLDVATSLATGVVLTIAAGAAAAVAAPIIATAPAWVPIAGGITLVAAGLGVTGWALAEHAPQWLKDGEVVWNSSKYTPEQVAAAHEGLNGFGAGFVDFAANIAGGSWIYKQMAKTTADVAGKALSLEGKVIEGEYRVLDDVGLLPGPAKTSAVDEVVLPVGWRGRGRDIDIDFVPEHMRGWHVLDNVIASARELGSRLPLAADVHLAAFKTLKDSREIGYFAKYVSEDLINPIGFAATIRSMASRGVINISEKQAWLDAATILEQQAIPKLQKVLAGPRPSYWTEEEARNLPRILNALRIGKSADMIMNDLAVST